MRRALYFVARYDTDGSHYTYQFPNRLLVMAENRASVLAQRPPADPLVFIQQADRLWIAEGDDGVQWAIAVKEA
jgi:hypothetical protein